MAPVTPASEEGEPSSKLPTIGLLFATQAPRGLHNWIPANSTTQLFGLLNSLALKPAHRRGSYQACSPRIASCSAANPLVRFAEGPAGRRARLVGTGKDVWEVVAAVRDNGGDAAETARYLEIPLGLVQAAITYYGAYRDEIDQWIEANEQEAAEAHAAWAAGQAAVRQ
jgi:uncharacterized protein (DUF433 family)